MERAIPAALSEHRHLFLGQHLAMVLSSIEAGNTAGQLWEIPQENAPPLLLLWDKGNNVLYLVGDGDASSLADFMASQVRPQALAEERLYFKVRALSPSVEEALPRVFPAMSLHAAPTLFFMDDPSLPLTVPPPTQPDVRILSTTPRLLSGDLAFTDHVLDEIRQMWPSEERFFDHGFGSAAVVENEIVCWCTAEYVSPALCGIGIATSPRHQRRGIATATAAHFLAEARQHGSTACWECAADNLPSVRVAEKLGLIRIAEEQYWRGAFSA